jgi:hypothetical protein
VERIFWIHWPDRHGFKKLNLGPANTVPQGVNHTARRTEKAGYALRAEWFGQP